MKVLGLQGSLLLVAFNISTKPSDTKPPNGKGSERGVSTGALGFEACQTAALDAGKSRWLWPEWLLDPPGTDFMVLRLVLDAGKNRRAMAWSGSWTRQGRMLGF